MTFCINIRLTSVSLKVITHVHWIFSLEYSTCMYLKTELLIGCFMLLWKKKSRLCSTLFRYSVQAIPNVCVILVNIFIIPPCWDVNYHINIKLQMHILILVYTLWMEIIVYMLDGCMLFSMARIYALQSLYETNWLCVPASNTCIVYILYMCVMLRNVMDQC